MSEINIIDNNRVLSKIKKFNQEAIQSLTIHGIPHLFKAKHKPIKFIWIVLTLASIILTIHFITQTINEFLEFNVTTEVRLKDESEFLFPAITICNKNKFSTNYSLSHLEEILNNHKLDYKMRYLNDNIMLIIKLFIKFYPAYILFEELNIEQRKKMTQPLNEMFLFGVYDYIPFDEKEFEWIYNKRYGNCFTFNLNSKFKTRKASLEDNLALDLYLGLPNEIFEEISTNKGIYLSIHDQNKNIYDDLDNVIEVSTGVETFVYLDRSVFYKYPYPYSDCEWQEDQIKNYSSIYLKQVLMANYSYSRSLCLDFCRHDLIISNNKSNECFTLDSSIRVPNMSFCQNKNFKNQSVTELYDDFVKNRHRVDKVIGECKKKCPLECKMVKYSSYVTTVDISSYVHDFSKNVLIYRNQKFKTQNLKNDLIRLRISFNSMSSMIYKESPVMSVFGLISNFGGILGLFLGMSLLSFNEFIEMIIQSVWMYFREKSKMAQSIESTRQL